jgi:hypothetical protein
MKNVVFRMIGHVMLIVYNDKTPTTEDHRRCVEAFRTMDPAQVRSLVITDGGAPTPAQRKDFVDILQGRQYRMAVLTDSIMVRGVVTAVSWFTTGTRAFPRAALDQAFLHLDIPPRLHDRIRAEIVVLQRELLPAQSA